VKRPYWLDALLLFAVASLVIAAPALVSSFRPGAATFSGRSAQPAESVQTVPGGSLGDTVQAGNMRISLLSAPLQPVVGLADLEALLLDAAGQPVADAKVSFDIDMTNMSHGLYVVDSQCNGDGRYTGRANFSMAGPWRIYVAVDRPGQPQTRVRFAFRVN
jgi:hypothetical protein